jgi:hypothetical protein
MKRSGVEPARGEAEGPRRHHFLEPVASDQIRSLIRTKAPSVWASLSRPGSGGPLMCTTAVATWARVLAAAAVRTEMLGRGIDNISWTEGGGYLVPGEAAPRDHHWLAVGPGLWLFDPTAAQFRLLAPASLERYVVHDGRSFVAWRSAELGNHPPA